LAHGVLLWVWLRTAFDGSVAFVTSRVRPGSRAASRWGRRCPRPGSRPASRTGEDCPHGL